MSAICKVVTRALCNGKTSAFQADDAGSIPAARSMQGTGFCSYSLVGRALPWLGRGHRFKSGYELHVFVEKKVFFTAKVVSKYRLKFLKFRVRV